MKTHFLKSVSPLVAASLIMLLVGCGGDDRPEAGSVRLFMTDAPAGGYAAVNVTVSRIRIHQSSTASENDAGWSDIILNPARKINLLDLTNGALEDLGQTLLTPGHYTQLRLVLAANSGGGADLANSLALTSDPTAEIALDTPSGIQSGIKLINEFDVASNQRVDLVLDFDALKSVVQRSNGTYLLKPVIKVVPAKLNGIEGFVDIAMLIDDVRVSAQVNGNVIASTTPNPQTGEFLIARLAPGSYDVVITAKGRATTVITGVPVATVESFTGISTSTNRLTLPLSTTNNASGTIALNPVSTTAVAYVNAKQTIGTGPVATVGTTAADPVSGNYLLTLPVAAPLLGQYGTGALPISVTAQDAAAGKYLLEASAEAYLTQQVSIEVSAAAATRNFTLVP